ncbi:hypothetical protein PLEOSDRAFT_171138 [Pleurotus ostreatus PC15]|uniref:Myb-like domain-containing protein n=1 Tax=Pleurotus ostreatus (strain PC15) TaxID=1137138 RepID=A0A067N9E9_PLEO1|nr:hypothetical protein PLEOSDRAFT_171138 [Pleurotus ostreatus PC15]
MVRAKRQKTIHQDSSPLKIRIKLPIKPSDIPIDSSTSVADPVQHQPSPAWDCEQGSLPDDSSQTPEDTTSQRQSKNARSPRWLPWQDRHLIKEVDNVRPFDEPNTKMVTKAWETLAETLRQHTALEGPQSVIDRTAYACRKRFEKLIQSHKRDETRSLQSTGTNEEVDAHVELLTGLAQLYDVHSSIKDEQSAQIKKKRSVESQASSELREASMKGLVHRESLVDVSALPGASVREKQAQRVLKRRPLSFSTAEKENFEFEFPPRKRRHSHAAALILEQISSDQKSLQELRTLDQLRHEELTNLHKETIGILHGISSLMEAQQKHDIERQAEEMERERQQKDQLNALTTAILTLAVNVSKDK